MAISNLHFQANRKQGTLSEVIEIARKAIVEGIEKYQLNSLPLLGAISSIATKVVEDCVRQIFLSHTKFFINDYDILNDEIKIRLKERISFEIRNNWLHVKARSYGVYSPSKIYQSKRTSAFGDTCIIFETDGTIDFNKDSFYELAEAIFNAASGKISEKISGFFNSSGKKRMLPDDQIRSEIRRNCILNDKLLAETFFITAISDHTSYIHGKEIVNIIINKLSGIKGLGAYETMADILLKMMPEDLSFSINSFNKESFNYVDLSLVPYREKYKRYHRGELALFGQHLCCFHLFNFANGPVFMVGPHELVERAAFLEHNKNKTSLILEDALSWVDIEGHHRFTSITLDKSEPVRFLPRPDLPIISFHQEINLEFEPENELLEGVYVKQLERVPMDGNVEEASAGALSKIGDIFRQMALSENISDEDKMKAFDKSVSLVQDLFGTCQEGKISETDFRQKTQYSNKEKDGETLDLSGIPFWRDRKQDGMPLTFLEKHYGDWLTAFRSDRDRVFQDQVRAHDLRLITGIHNQLREEDRGRKLHDFVKTRSARLDQELENATISDLMRDKRLAANLYTRGKRAAEAANDIQTKQITLSHP